MEGLPKDDAGLECLGIPLPSAGDLTLGALMRQTVLAWLRRARRPLARAER